MVQQYQRITAALVFGCILWLLVKTWMYDRRRLRLSRRLALLGAAACVLGIVRLTLWRPGGAPPGAYNLRLFWSYGRWLTKYNTLDVILQVYFNVELYIPLGLFLHNVLPRGHKPVWIGLGRASLPKPCSGHASAACANWTTSGITHLARQSAQDFAGRSTRWCTGKAISGFGGIGMG